LVDICSGTIDRDYRLFKNVKLKFVDNEMLLSLLVLLLLTILSNFIFVGVFINSDYLDESIFIHPKHSSLFDYDILKYYFKIWLIIGFGFGVPMLSFSENEFEGESRSSRHSKYYPLAKFFFLIRTLSFCSLGISIA